MVDEEFASGHKILRRRATIYLASAAVIPLCALMLLALQQSSATPDAQAGQFSLVMIVLTAVALLFAFVAYQRLHDTALQLAAILDRDS